MNTCEKPYINQRGVDNLIKCIIFDAMGVVFTVGDDTNDLLVPYILEKKPDVAKEKIFSLYHEASLGNISPKSLWEGVLAKQKYLRSRENIWRPALHWIRVRRLRERQVIHYSTFRILIHILLPGFNGEFALVNPGIGYVIFRYH